MIDLHTHSTASDGTCTPERLMDLAVSVGLSAIALTDHDTLSGLDRAAARAREAGIRLIPGVEIEIEAERGEFHLLGLGLVADRGALEDALARVRQSRHERNLRMVEKFQAAGIPLSLEELTELARGEILSRAHFARRLAARGIVSSTEQAFSRYLAKGRPFYEPRRCLPLAEATSLIRRAGGIPVIAHPLSLELAGPALAVFLGRCKDQGVLGIEAHHPNHSLKQARKLAQLGRRLGLALTAGSDFHGENMPHRVLGRTSGGREIPDKVLEALALRLPVS
jgi:predicted metal-dependent phosphoesterase TrpH